MNHKIIKTTKDRKRVENKNNNKGGNQKTVINMMIYIYF